MDSGAATAPGQGQAISKSDVGDSPDSAITKGDVLFIPEEGIAELSSLAGFSSSDTGALQHAFFPLDEDQLVDLGGVQAPIDGRGLFTVPVSSGGPYVLCLANIFVDHTAGPPYAVVGCATAGVPEGGSITVWHGEGGVEASPD